MNHKHKLSDKYKRQGLGVIPDRQERFPAAVPAEAVDYSPQPRAVEATPQKKRRPLRGAHKGGRARIARLVAEGWQVYSKQAPKYHGHVSTGVIGEVFKLVPPGAHFNDRRALPITAKDARYFPCVNETDDGE